MFTKVKQQLMYILESPQRFFVLCLGICFFTLVFDGSLWRLYSLHKQQQILVEKRAQSKKETIRYQALIQKAKDPEFLKKQAREKFDWVEEDELVFLFAGEE